MSISLYYKRITILLSTYPFLILLLKNSKKSFLLQREKLFILFFVDVYKESTEYKIYSRDTCYKIHYIDFYQKVLFSKIHLLAKRGLIRAINMQNMTKYPIGE